MFFFWWKKWKKLEKIGKNLPVEKQITSCREPDSVRNWPCPTRCHKTESSCCSPRRTASSSSPVGARCADSERIRRLQIEYLKQTKDTKKLKKTNKRHEKVEKNKQKTRKSWKNQRKTRKSGKKTNKRHEKLGKSTKKTKKLKKQTRIPYLKEFKKRVKKSVRAEKDVTFSQKNHWCELNSQYPSI